MSSDTALMERDSIPRAHSFAQRRLTLIAVLALLVGVLVSSPSPADAQQPNPSVGDTARLLGYLWADGSYANGVWDATGPSGGSDLIQRLVIDHGGTWVDRTQLMFTLPAPYDWAEWKGTLPNDDARTNEAVRHPNFLAALLEGEGSVAGLVYDQSSCCTAGFTGGRLTELHALLLERGLSSATITMFGDADSGRINLAATDYAELRASHQFVCPSSGAAIRVPGAENYAAFGPINWFNAASEYGDVVRTDCVPGQSIPTAAAPIGDCVATSDGNGNIRLSWSFQRGNVAVRRNNLFVRTVYAIDQVTVDAPANGSYSYEIRVNSDGLQTSKQCGVVATTDAFTPAPPAGQTCMGSVVTKMGTGGDDSITGTAGADVIHGFGGDDEVFGLQGNDLICGGSGDDTIHAGKGNDTVWGGQGFDILYGAQGNDELRSVGSTTTDQIAGARMFGGVGNDVLEGSNRWDRMQGGPGHDVMRGYEGRDWMRGGPGNDQLVGSAGIDDLHGGNGNDYIQIQDRDVVRGGAGTDGCLFNTVGSNTVLSCEVRLTQANVAAFIANLN